MKQHIFKWLRSSRPVWAAVSLRVATASAHAEVVGSGVCLGPPRRVGEKPQLLGHVTVQGQVKQVVSALREQLALTRFPVVCSLPRDQYQLLMVKKPEVPESELAGSLSLLLSSQLDETVRPEDVAWLAVPALSDAGGGGPQVMSIVAQHEAAFSQRNWWAGHGVRVQAVDVAEHAQLNLAALMHMDHQVVCLLIPQADGVQLTVSDEQGVYLSVFVREALLAMSEQELLESGALDRMALEVQRALDFFRRNHIELNLDEVLVLPAENGLDLVSSLSDRLAEKVRALDLSDYFEWPQGSDLQVLSEQARYAFLMGSALRGVLDTAK